jgi:hypothetical protein
MRPVVAVDGASNVHIVFSDNRNVYLTSSHDQGASFTPPVRVNNGAGTKTAVAPWVAARSSGKLNVFWWGTSHTDPMDYTSPWQVFMAQTQNAFANVPAIAESAATGVMHVGAICVNGLACPGTSRALAEYFAPDTALDGNALIVYPDDKNSGTATGAPRTWFVKQVGGLNCEVKIPPRRLRPDQQEEFPAPGRTHEDLMGLLPRRWIAFSWRPTRQSGDANPLTLFGWRGPATKTLTIPTGCAMIRLFRSSLADQPLGEPLSSQPTLSRWEDMPSAREIVQAQDASFTYYAASATSRLAGPARGLCSTSRQPT